MPTSGNRLRALDGLRGLAVAAVVAFHLGHFSGGWLGVDAFFTLSGFLITSLLLAEVERGGRADLRRFWRRRIRRLQPAAVVCIAAVVATAGWWAAAGTGLAVRGEALAALFSVENWHLLWSHRPYAAGGSPSAFEHFWSLAIEEQFYVVWPLVFAGAVAAFGAARRRVSIAVIALAGMAASWVLLALSGVQRGYLGTDTRIGSILAGALLACVVPLGRERRRIPGARALGIAGVTGMVVLWTFAGWPPRIPLALLLPLHALCAVAAIVGATHAPSRAIASTPLAGLGRVSYGVYLWHWPVIVICTPERLGHGEVYTDAARLGLTAALTAMSWFVVERPIRVERVLRATRLAFPVAAVAAAIAIVLGASEVAPAPVWARATGELVQSRVKVVVPKARPARAPRRVLVVGDSLPTSLLATTDASGVSLQVGEGHLLEQFAHAGITAASATLTGCPVIDEAIVADGAARTKCQANLRRVLPKALDTFRPDLVLWYDSADAYEIQLPDGSRHDPAASAAEAAALRARMAARVAWFAAHGARVAFVSPGPNRDHHDDEDLRRDSFRSMRLLDDVLHAVAAAHPDEVVGVIPMSDLTCPRWRTTNHCADLMPGGKHYRESDGAHFELAGAVAAGQWLVTRVAQLRLHG